jgi:hypothetical protein
MAQPRVSALCMGWLLALGVGLSGAVLAFWLLATPDQRVYTLARGMVSLQAEEFTSRRLTLPSWGQPAPARTIVQAVQQTPGWLQKYHQILWQAGVAGLLMLGLVYGAAPQRFARPRGRRLRHVRGPRVRMPYLSSPVGQAVRAWLVLGGGLSGLGWLGWRWLTDPHLATVFPAVRSGLCAALGIPSDPTLPALLLCAGYGSAALALAAWWGWGEPLMARWRRNRGGLTLGGLPLPASCEPLHFLISGRTGSGKTQAIAELLRGIRARRDRAIIADPGGGLLARFYQPGDVLLNPFDRRGVVWSPFAEITAPYDYMTIARAAIPDGQGESQAWHGFAQQLLANALRTLAMDGRGTVADLLRVLAASPQELGVLLAGTPAAVITEKENERMYANTRTTVSRFLDVWAALVPPSEGQTPFSIRAWVRGTTAPATGWLFLTYQDDQVAQLRHLIATWLDLALIEGLTLPETHASRLWYVMDELDSLGQIASLKDGLTKLRKRGGCCIAGLQTIAQLRSTYDRDTAQTLLSSLATKLMLAAGDGETAEYFQRDIGQREVERAEATTSAGRTGRQSTRQTTRSRRRVTEWLILASELQGLPARTGYLRLAEDADLWPIEVPLVPMPAVVPPYIPRG